MENQRIQMVDLEGALRGPEAEQVKTRLREALEQLRLNTKREMDRGLPSEEFERAKKIQAAAEAAEAVVAAA